MAVPARKGPETILLVDDEEGVRKLVLSVLKSNRYDVLEAGNGAMALAAFEKNVHKIDMAPTEVVMAQMAAPAVDSTLPPVFANRSTSHGARTRAPRFGLSLGRSVATSPIDRLVDQWPRARLIGIGAEVTRRPLPHHRAYGSVHGGSSRLR
jgi:CheY-like chemotaxis protein